MTTPVRAPVEVQFRATGVDATRAQMKLVKAEAEGISHSASIGIGELARGIGRIAESGKAGAFAMRELTGGVMRLGQALGPEVGLGAIVISLGAVVVEHFTKMRDEMKKTTQTFEQEIGKMANAGESSKLQQQLRELEFGTAYDKNNKLQPNSQFVSGAFKGSLMDLRGQRAMIIDELSNAHNPSQAAMLLKQRDDITALIKPIEDQERQLSQAILNVMSQPQSMIGLLPTRITAKTPGAEARDEEKLIDNLMSMIAKSMPGFREGATNPTMQANEVAENAKKLNELLVKYIPGVDHSKDGRELLGFGSGLTHATAGKLPETKGDQVAKDFLDNVIKPMADTIQRGIASTIGDSISAGFTAAFQKGATVGKVATAFASSVLSTVGGVFKQVGEEVLVGLTFMKAIKDAIISWAPELGILAAVGLIAFGSMLQAAGGRMSANAAGGGGGVGSVSGSAYTSPATVKVNPSAMANVSGIAPAAPVHVTIIGKDDPQAGRQLLEMIARAQRRGSVVG